MEQLLLPRKATRKKKGYPEKNVLRPLGAFVHNRKARMVPVYSIWIGRFHGNDSKKGLRLVPL
jgi:hypothetical protein